jgi:thioredoxin 1
MKMKEIKSLEEFEAAIAEGVSLMDFNAPWCGPCRSQEPILESISDQLSGKASVSAINVDENRDIAAKFGIQSIPTLIAFKESKEMQRFVGLQSEETLLSTLETLTD